MLLHLVNPNLNKQQYKECVETYLMDLFYPEKKLIERYNKLFLSAKTNNKTDNFESIKMEIISQTINKHLSSDKYGYPMISNDKNNPIIRFPFPYMEKYVELFLKRKNNLSYANRRQDPKQIFGLSDDKGNPQSKNHGNFYHFINVLMSLSRVIQYFCFSKQKSPISTFFPSRLKRYMLFEDLLYKIDPCGAVRIFKLMLAGFYHDLGKTIIDQRHSIEGEILILADQTSASLYKLNNIINCYKKFKHINSNERFERDDLTLLSKMLLYHDQFGTLGTGEDGYLRIVKVVDSIKTLSLCRHHSHSTDRKQIHWSACTIFDLWVLNIADILASTNDIGKFELQTIWYNKSKANKIISKFLNDEEDGTNRLHDLKIALRLLFSHFHRDDKLKVHVSDISKIMKEAVENSRFHTSERLRRLITSSLIGPVKYLKENSNLKRAHSFASAIEAKLREKNWTFTIERSLEVLGTSEQFKKKFSWIGKMDYALGFFSIIAKETLQLVEAELSDIVRLHYEESIGYGESFINPKKIEITHRNAQIQEAISDAKFNPDIEGNVLLLKFGKIGINRGDLNKIDDYRFKYDGKDLKILKVELLPISNTSWIRERTLGDIDDEDFLSDLNAQFFLDNFTATIITIISYLLNREKEIDTPKDFQFLYAKDKLNTDKIRKITSMVGPFQTNKSVHYILQNIYIY